MPDWDYSNQYDPYPQSYDYNFQNNFHSSQSSWGFTSPESNFQSHCPQFSQYSFPDSASYPSFPEPPIEDKVIIAKDFGRSDRDPKIICKHYSLIMSTNFPKSYSSFPESLKEKSLWAKTMKFVQ